jgi:hypothetical protein
VRRIPASERRARLVARHRLRPGDRAADVPSVARSLVAIHSTDPVSVFLSIRARADVEPGDVEHALYEERSVVRLLGMRRTLFVVERELADVVHAACTLAVAERELGRLGSFVSASELASDPKAWIESARKAALEVLERRGEATTRDLAAEAPILGERLRVGVGTRFETTQSAASRVLFQLAAERHVVRTRPRGSWISSQYRWAPWATWLGAPATTLDPEATRAELVKRWLTAFGPGTETDLRWWGGWTARDVRAALSRLEHVAVDLDGADGIVLADDVATTPPGAPAAALLPGLDATTMGWKERGWFLGEHGAVLFDRNGNAGPTVWWEGRVVGGWAQRPDGEIAYRLLEDAGSEALAAVETEAARLRDWLGAVRFSPRFSTPLQRELAA